MKPKQIFILISFIGALVLTVIIGVAITQQLGGDAVSAAIECRIPAAANRTIINFNLSLALLTDSSPSRLSTDPLTVNIPPSTYNINLAQYDDHSGHPNPQGDQSREQYYVIGYNSAGQEVFRTNSTDDLPDGLDYNEKLTNTALVIDEPVTTIRAFHIVGTYNDNIHSIWPTCVGFDDLNAPAAAVCGDGTVELEEVCDAGANNGTVCTAAYGETCSYCNSECSAEVTVTGGTCGDGTTQAGAGEACDAGENNGTVCNPAYGQSCSYCTNSCQLETITGASCGDGTVNTAAGEQCDQGTSLNGTACTAAYGEECSMCTINCQSQVVVGAYCGDGELQTTTEQCDDGNSDNGDGCSSTCETETPPIACGNGVVETGEQCDQGTENSFSCVAAYGNDCNYCSQSCTLVVVSGGSCGDGVLDADLEQCDAGSENGQSCTAEYGGICGYCSNQCESVTVSGGFCGDGNLDSPGEQCDDNNTADGDGCSAACTVETPSPTCGDGNIDTAEGETCDDSNTTDGDGCNQYCLLEYSGPQQETVGELPSTAVNDIAPLLIGLGLIGLGFTVNRIATANKN